MKQWEGPVRESAQDVAVFLCLCKYIYVPAYLRHSALKSNLSPNQNTCLYWRSRKPVCELLQGSPSLQTIEGRSLHIQNYAHAQPKHPHKKRAQHTPHTGRPARASCGAAAHLRRRRERRAARAQGRDGQAEGALKVALPAKLLHEPVGPAPRRGEGAARVGDVGGVDDVGAELVQGRRVGCPRGGGRPVRVDGCLAMVRAICF